MHVLPLTDTEMYHTVIAAVTSAHGSYGHARIQSSVTGETQLNN